MLLKIENIFKSYWETTAEVETASKRHTSWHDALPELVWHWRLALRLLSWRDCEWANKYSTRFHQQKDWDYCKKSFLIQRLSQQQWLRGYNKVIVGGVFGSLWNTHPEMEVFNPSNFFVSSKLLLKVQNILSVDRDNLYSLYNRGVHTVSSL